jgi:ketosteroid isomerase-like protein
VVIRQRQEPRILRPDPQRVCEKFGEVFEPWLPLPNVSHEFAPEVIEVSASGDLAWDRGTFHSVMETPEGTVEDVGKYLMIWKKMDGEWKVVAECGNSDLPVAQE